MKRVLRRLPSCVLLDTIIISQHRVSYTSRLEFVEQLTDSVEPHPDENEGDMAKRHTGLVQQQALVDIAAEIDLAGYIRLSGGERNAGGAQKEAIIADAMEALIGAVFLYGGYAAAEKLVTHFWAPHLHKQAAPPEDPKTRLQEWAQQRGLALPEYTVIDQQGPDHAPTFTIAVQVDGLAPGAGTAASKRAAEKAAAAALLQMIDEMEKS